METEVHTLQKSMDFTPLLPSAGPTGGEGEAWPAPTMSLTIWSRGGTRRAIEWREISCRWISRSRLPVDDTAAACTDTCYLIRASPVSVGT